jgi:hypothetical protein
MWRYVLKFQSVQLVVSLLSLILLTYIDTSFLERLNYTGFVQSFVALNSGVIIAVFIAIFNSDNKNMELFRTFTKASKQTYVILLLNTALICVASLFINNIGIEGSLGLPHQLTLNVMLSFYTFVLTMGSLYITLILLRIYFRR